MPSLNCPVEKQMCKLTPIKEFQLESKIYEAMAFTIAVHNHFCPKDQFLGWAGSFSQSSSKLEEVSSTLSAALRSPLPVVKSVVSSSTVTDGVREGTVVSTLTDIIPNACRVN
jgi:hypothetical protein